MRRNPYLSYKKPVLTRIKLDPEGAILAVCQVGGVYMFTYRGLTHCAAAGAGVVCRINVKGRAGRIRATAPRSTAPS